MSWQSKPVALEVCSCGAEFIPAAKSLEGAERERASFRKHHTGCRNRAEWQRCPICDGCGTVPADFYTQLGLGTSRAREQCRSCTGTGLIARPSSFGIQLQEATTDA